MKVLMISADRSVFVPGSGFRERLLVLSAGVEQLDVIVLTRRRTRLATVVQGKLLLHPTNSFSLFNYIFDAVKIGSRILAASDYKLKTKSYLITCQDPFLTGLAGQQLAKKFGSKLEIQLHTDVLNPVFRRFSVKNFIYYWLARWLLPQADQVRVVSERLKESLLASKLVQAGRIYVLPIFVSLPPPADRLPWPAASGGRRIILMAGRLEPEKRYDLALRAFYRLNDQRLVLAVAGTGRQSDVLKKMALRLGLADRVWWLGQLTPALLRAGYQAADLVLHTAAYEGYGLVLAEAALAGRPLVSTDVGIAREIGARLASPSPVSLATAIRQQLDSPSLPQLPPVVAADEYYRLTLDSWRQLN